LPWHGRTVNYGLSTRGWVVSRLLTRAVRLI